MTRYVLHDDVRWKVVEGPPIVIDGAPGFELSRRFRVGTQWHTRRIVARQVECQEYHAPARIRRIRGTLLHRRGRPVVFEYDQQTGVIELRLKRQRKGYTTTLEGLYDLCARQEAANAKRDREFKRRTRKR